MLNQTEIMIDLMYKDDFIKQLGREPSFEERRIINWAYRYMSSDKASEYLVDKFLAKKEEKKVKDKSQRDEVS